MTNPEKADRVLNRARGAGRQLPDLGHFGSQQDSEDRVPEFHPHLAANIAPANHRSPPRRPVEPDENRLRAVLGMARYQNFAIAPVFHRIRVVSGRNLDNGSRCQFGQFDSAIDLRLADRVIDRVIEIRNRREDSAIG